MRSRALGERAETTVHAVLSASPDAVGYQIGDLAACDDRVVPLLEECLGDPRREPNERLHAALGLAGLGRGPNEILVEAIRTAPGRECGNLVAALRPAGQEVLAALRRHATAPGDPATQARYATVLLHLGDPSAAAALLRPSETRAAAPRWSTDWPSGMRTWPTSARRWRTRPTRGSARDCVLP